MRATAAAARLEPLKRVRGEFTLSYHFYSPRNASNHLELFLDIDGKSELETWRHYPGKNDRSSDGRWNFEAAEKHRRLYLTYCGAISNSRGKLRPLRQGNFIDRRTGWSEVSNAQDVHPFADRRTGWSAMSPRISGTEVSNAQDVHAIIESGAEQPSLGSHGHPSIWVRL